MNESDHRLVMAGIRIKMKKTQTEMMNKRFWIEGLKEDAIRDRFTTQLCNRWEQAKEKDLSTVEKRWMEIKDMEMETARQILGYEKRRKKKPWITREVLELSDRRKEMRKTKANSDEDRERCREITKEIKRKAIKCKET